MSSKLKAWLVDTGENVGLAGVLPFLGALISEQGGLLHVATWKAAAASGVSAGLAALYSALAASRSNTISPASLMPAQQPGQAEQDAPPDAPADDPTPATTVAQVRTVVLPEKNGKGGRLGRHQQHDERSRAYKVTPHPAPKTVTWKRHVKPYDQRDLGSCTGNAMAGALSTAPFKHRFGERAAIRLYEAATTLDDVPGAYPPDDTGSSGLAVAKAAQHAGYLTTYRHCFNVDDVISALQSGPVIAGTDWLSGMDTPDAEGYVKVAGAVRGGHEYELVGVDVDQKHFVACNSWGTDWGVGGYFKVTFDDFGRLLARGGDVTVPVHDGTA